MNKAETLQELIDLTVENVNELVIGYPDMPIMELFKLAVQNALEQCQIETTMKQFNSPIGVVDTKNVAFSLQDNETVAVIQGRHEFAMDLGFDVLGGEDDDEEST